MQLSACLAPWLHDFIAACEIRDLENDSRNVQPGDVFLAYPGTEVDGRCYILQAIERGAAAIVYEKTEAERFLSQLQQLQVPCVAMEGLFPLLGPIAARCYGHPADQLTLIGVTGTNGKSTVAYQLAYTYTALGSKTAYIGTLGQGLVPELARLQNTTPDGLQLQKLYRDYVTSGLTRVCMEVSSHALSLGRIAGVPFQEGIFTNLSQEHLDFHHTMAAYQEAKALLFETPTLTHAILNGEDQASAVMAVRARAHGATVLQYGLQKSNDVFVQRLTQQAYETTMQVSTPWGKTILTVPVLGQFNVYNILAVLTSLLVAGYSLESIRAVLEKLPTVPGRMEVVTRQPLIVVDFAHTPAALKNVLNTLKAVSSGQLIIVFGCGGERDQGKRPLMGKIASDYADVVIITNDNPRRESPNVIMDAIQSGILPGRRIEIIPDRRAAIEKAISMAHTNDTILVAGKGHESEQQIGERRYAFSDQAIIRTMIEE